MKRRDFLKTVGLGTAAAALPAWVISCARHQVSGRPAAARPNVLLIMADDMGFSDAGCYGGEIETPNLDAMAAGGIRFTSMWPFTLHISPSRPSGRTSTDIKTPILPGGTLCAGAG